MTDPEKVYTVLELIDEKSKQVSDSEPIVISTLRLSRSGVSRLDTMDILVMLSKRPGYVCISINNWPDFEDYNTKTDDVIFEVKPLATFYDMLHRYEMYAMYERDPVKARKLFPRHDLEPDINRLIADGYDPSDFLQEPQSQKHLAVLGFESISRPQVTIGSKTYLFSSMRGGKAFEIITYCLDHAPDRDVPLSTLRTRPGLQRMTNIKASIQHSRFDSSNGPLRMFIKATPASIKVARSVQISDTDLAAIEAAADT
jgi:hypothetical protein